MTPKAAFGSQPEWLVQDAGPGLRTPSGKLTNPFLSASQTMVAPPSNPFFEALSEGKSEGVLILHSTNEDVPVYGLGASARRSIPASDRAILREIRLSLGIASPRQVTGSSVTSTRTSTTTTTERPEIAQAADPLEENPFVKAVDPAPPVVNQAAPVEKETIAAPKQESEPAKDTKAASDPVTKTDSGTATETKTASDASTTKVAPVTAAPVVDPTPVAATTPPVSTAASGALPSQSMGVIRPYAMLKLGADGAVQTMRATRFDLRTFETAEFGIMPMNVLFFPKPAEKGTSVAVADFNNDRIPDVGFDDAGEGFLRLLYGKSDGTYEEGMKIEIGSGLRSLAAGDFDRDGRTDIAVSDTGIGTLTILYLGEPGSPPRYRTYWLSAFRDYLTSADTTGTGAADLIGASFVNLAEVLNIGRYDGAAPGKKFALDSVLDRTVSIYNGYKLQLNAILFHSSLSVNLQNLQSQMVNIANVQAGQAGSDFYVIVGDINFDNTISMVLATPKK